MTVYTCHNKLCVSIPTIVPDPSTHFVCDEFAIGICCYSPLSHCTWCILFNPPPSPPPPPQKKKERKKKTICIRITFNFTWVFTTFTKTIMHLVYPSNFVLPLSSISLGTRVIPGRNWKQSLFITHLFIYVFFWGGGVGEGIETRCIMVYVQMANYSKNDSDACFWRGRGG